MALLRFERLDALRGAAVVWMICFHFCFDLSHFKLIDADFYRDPFWTLQRIAIVSSFLLCAGISQAVALQQGLGWPRFWRRWLQVAGCALLVTAGSMWMFPRSFISFGILHALALMLLLMRFLGSRLSQKACLLLGAVLLMAPLLWQHPWFDSRATYWLGFATHKPITEDYVPLVPWVALMLWGFALGRWLLARQPQWLAGSAPRPLVLLGRWSLTIYMLHQPLLIGLLTAAATIRA
ncbi:MAG TPA: heparan-alpha-glucosaminide N-acetyltransferase [Burkholderiaceae bacterium]